MEAGSRGVDPRDAFTAAVAELRHTLHKHGVAELQWPTDGSVIDPVMFYREYVANSTPCVIRGMAKSWLAMRKWATAAGLAAQLGPDTEVNVALTPNGRADAVTRVPKDCIRGWDDDDAERRVSSHPTPTVQATEHVEDVRRRLPQCEVGRVEVFVEPKQVKMPFKAFLGQLLSQRRRSGEPFDAHRALCPDAQVFQAPARDVAVVYAQYQNNCLMGEYEPLLVDVGDNVRDFGERLFGSAPDACNLWVGSEHAVTSMHQDWYENLYAVVAGKKVFTLIPPWESTFVNKRDYYSAEYSTEVDAETGTERFVVAVDDDEANKTPWVRLDPREPPSHPANADDASAFEGCQPLSVTVGPGDVLYLPATWFHHVAQVNDGEGKVVAVNYWFDMQFGPASAIQPFIEAMHRATRSS